MSHIYIFSKSAQPTYVRVSKVSHCVRVLTVLCKILFKSILKIQDQDSILKILFDDTFRKILLYYLPIVQVALKES